jgi:hypothetical protein
LLNGYDTSIYVKFEEYISAKNFSGYFGKLREEFIGEDILSINIDFRSSTHINLFCISKIILTLFEVIDRKKITIYWPSTIDYKQNKMLRFLYNKGILDLFFNSNIDNIIEGDITKNYGEYYDFSECFDSAIFPYKIFNIDKENLNYDTEVEKVVKQILNHVKTNINKYRSNSYEYIENRLFLYLFEIIENIYSHAYDKNGQFAVLVTYDYLPGYVWKKDESSKEKYESRVQKLQTNIPMSIYGDIQDRYMGGLSVFIDDVGKGIDNTSGGYYQQLYRDTFLEGLAKTKRGKGKTILNGLKLVGDQIANNGDYLWLHDNFHWIGSYCIEKTTNIAKEDKSRNFIQKYEHPYINGVTYEININLSRNSKEKLKSYENFGVQLHLEYDELKSLVQNALNFKEQNSDYALIDLFDSKNLTSTSRIAKSARGKVLFYRSRAIRKEQFKGELFDNILENLSRGVRFNELVIYDLNQTAFFQLRAQIETEDYSRKINKCGIQTIILLSEELHVFVLKYTMGKYFISKQNAVNYITLDKKTLVKYIEYIHYNDNLLLDSLIFANKENLIINSDIKWSGLQIKKYLNIETMFSIRDIFIISRRTLNRINGLLGNNIKMYFIENFMNSLFGEYVNEYINKTNKKVFVGSIILTKQTERKKSIEDDYKIYFYSHPESFDEYSDKYIFLFKFPNANNGVSKIKYRRVESTHKIEAYTEESEQFKIFLNQEKYQPLLCNIDYKIGLYPEGLISVEINEKLYKSFLDFVVLQLKIISENYTYVLLHWGIKLPEDDIERYTKNIEEADDIRSINRYEKKITFEKALLGKNPFIDVYLYERISIAKLLEHKTEEQNIKIISIFNENKISDKMDSIFNNGYLPFIPVYYTNGCLISDEHIKRFDSFVKTLMPTYRTEIEKYMIDIDTCYKQDFSFELERFLNLNMSTSKYGNILHDVNQYVLRYSINKIDSNGDESKEDLLVMLIVWWYENQINNHKDCESLLERIIRLYVKMVQNEASSILDFYFVIVLYISNANLGFSTIERNSQFFKTAIENTNNPILKIVLANIINQWNNVELISELNDIFISNDIALYYKMLYQNIFNNCGDDHDSIIGKYIKERNLSEEEKLKVPFLLKEIISLLKLTKPYFEEFEIVNQIGNELIQLCDKQKFSSQFHEKCDELKKSALTRFIVFDKENFKMDFKKFIVDIVGTNIKNIQSDLLDKVETLEDHIVGNPSLPEKMKKIVIPDDAYVIEEITYLFVDAFKHSDNIKITTKNNQENENIVWIDCKVNEGFIIIRIFNHLTRDFEEVRNEIFNKRRVGKTHLEKFNIKITYLKNPDEVIDNIGDSIETKIEIPYFV